MPLSSLSDFIDTSTLKEGDPITILNGVTICEKYIPKRNTNGASCASGNRTRKKKEPIAPLFAEHADTEQLAYNLSAFKPGDQVEITLKMHGTSQRTGYLPKLSGYKRTLKDWILRRPGTPIYDWGYVSGTRRTVMEDYDGGYYGSNAFREQHSKAFEGKLQKGETVYYEVVGFTDTGVPIMPSCDNKKVDKLTGDKNFTKQYGGTTVFSYGCDPDGRKVKMNLSEGTLLIGDNKPIAVMDGVVYDKEKKSDLYVYRMTITNEDGFVVEYPPDFMRYRCEQMNVKCVPVLWRGFLDEPDDWTKEKYDPGAVVKQIAGEYNDGPDPVGKSHIREGVVCRIVNRPKFTAYKDKNFSFKVLEGIIKENSDAPDIEEAQEDVA